MGSCLSKKKESSTSSSVSGDKSVSSSTRPLQSQTVTVSKPKVETEPEASLKKDKKQEDEGQVKREVFLIKHRKSHDGKNSKHPSSDGDASTTSTNVAAEANGGVVVRTSSCTREEVDAILLQCGRLSRSSSGKAAASGERGRGRKYSGSKRSHDFDHCENDTANTDLLCEDDNGVAGEDRHHLRQHRHHRRSPGPSSERRRRTPSRERDLNQRSSSRERRVSISPSRRSSDTTTSNPANSNNNNNNTTTTRPAKMVSVPPTVSSLAMDKSNNGGGGITRISVKRNVGAASPRSQSPARANGNAANGKVLLVSENQQQQPSLSRNSSRKAEQSPYRRNPLSEIDFDSLAYPQSANNNSNSVQSRPKKETEPEAYQKTKVDTKDNTKSRTSSKKTMEQQEEEEQIKGQSSMTENVVLKTTVMSSGLDNLKPQTLTRSRSSRRSRDLDHLLYHETQMNPAQSYTSLLLEDIQNFHQKNCNNNNNNNTPSIPLPASVTKACAILEAVADLNSTTSSNLPANHYAKRVPDSSTKEHPFVESEVVVIDDVLEPSLQKYVTVSRGGSLLGGVADMEDQESSGSNSFTVSGHKHLGFSSSCPPEPNSGDHSTDRSTSSRLNSSKRRECDFQGMGGGRFRGNEGVHAIPIVVTAATST